MIELIDQSGLNNADRTIPVTFGYRCSLCGINFPALSQARAEMHRCAPGSREAFAAREAAAVVPPKPKRPRAVVAVAPPVVTEAPKRGRPRKVPTEA